MSRFTIIGVITIVSKFILLMWVALMRRKRHASTMYYFAYCDGSMRRVVSRETVDRASFMNYDLLIGYPVLHISRDTIYFDIIG